LNSKPRTRARWSAIHATLAWRDRKVEGGGNEWFAVNSETVIEVARMVMGKPT
jgi:hypothetical protein